MTVTVQLQCYSRRTVIDGPVTVYRKICIVPGSDLTRNIMVFALDFSGKPIYMIEPFSSLLK